MTLKTIISAGWNERFLMSLTSGTFPNLDILILQFGQIHLEFGQMHLELGQIYLELGQIHLENGQIHFGIWTNCDLKALSAQNRMSG